MVEGRILIVEDEHIVSMGIKKMLKNLGYLITGVAVSGEDAINKAESTFPDLVLMDIMLKGELDGVEASKIIIKKFGIPVVYLTACSDNKMIEKAWNTGISGYITKPFDEKDLKKAISVALCRHRMQNKKFEKSLDTQKDSEKLRLFSDSHFNS